MNNIQSQIERLRLFKEPGFIGTALQRKAVGETASTMERMLAVVEAARLFRKIQSNDGLIYGPELDKALAALDKDNGD